MRRRKKPTLNQAVRDLRLALGDTQQQFAHRLGLAISTVVRYELTREPKGKALAQLEQVAAEHGLSDLSAVFKNALDRELGIPDRGPSAVGTYVCAEEHEPYLAAFFAVLERSKWATLRPKLLKLLEAPANDYRKREQGEPLTNEERTRKIFEYAQLQKKLEAENLFDRRKGRNK